MQGGQADSDDQPTTPAEPLKVTLKRRLEADGRWPTVEPLRDQMMREARAKGLTKQQAQDWTYGELERMYPAPTEPPAEHGDSTTTTIDDVPESSDSPARPREGLGDIPADWPDLPDNAPLAVELGWVQAQRLRVVEERPNRQSIVRLERAGSPAPSWAALGWLDTSIRNPSKFVDVCVKGLAQQELESEVVRRERRSIEDVRTLLAETMLK